MKRVLAVLSIVLLISTLSLKAEDLTTIITRAKINCEQFRKDVRDLSYTESFRGPDNNLTIRTCYWKNGLSRIGAVNAFPAELRDGRNNWVLYDPADTKMSESIYGALPLSFDAKCWYSSLPVNATLEGNREKAGGKNCYVIRYRDEMDWEYALYINARTFDLVKTECKGAGRDSVTANSAWVKIAGGWEIPTVQTVTDRYEDVPDSFCEPIETVYTLKDVKVNKGLSDDLFNPEKVAAENRPGKVNR